MSCCANMALKISSKRSATFYAETMGRPGSPPGIYSPADELSRRSVGNAMSGRDRSPTPEPTHRTADRAHERANDGRDASFERQALEVIEVDEHSQAGRAAAAEPH